MERENKIQIGEHDLPEEIVEDILSRLPVKSLLKSRCVSKPWLSLIDSEQFIKIHVQKSTENKLLSHNRIIISNLLDDSEPNSTIIKISCWASLLKEPLDNPHDGKSIGDDVVIVGSCNGLVCLVQATGRFILWNPSTKRSMDLPEAADNVDMYNFSMYGFGYDESSDDYKVLTIITSETGPRIGRVYSLKSHSWNTFEKDEEFKLRICDDIAGVFVSGNLHWFGDNGYGVDFISFDLKNEVFGMVDKPFCSSYANSPILTLGVIDGCLSVLCEYEDISKFNLWVIKEYGVKESWIKLYTFSSVNNISHLNSIPVHSFCRGPSGELLLIYPNTTEWRICCYYPQNNFHCSRIINIDEVYDVGFYVESLVSLGPNAGEESFWSIDAEHERGKTDQNGFE